MTDVRLLALIDDLRALPAETAWLEFKENNTDPRVIGRLISAVSNAARLEDKDFGYVVWGVRDTGHAVAGTRFEPSSEKHRRQPLEFWLSQMLRPGSFSGTGSRSPIPAPRWWSRSGSSILRPGRATRRWHP